MPSESRMRAAFVFMRRAASFLARRASRRHPAREQPRRSSANPAQLAGRAKGFDDAAEKQIGVPLAVEADLAFQLGAGEVELAREQVEQGGVAHADRCIGRSRRAFGQADRKSTRLN